MRNLESPVAPAGFRLGDPISLADLLALPRDGRRYTRDEQGRLALMSPDHARRHGHPLTRLTALLNRSLPGPWAVEHERSIALPIVWSLTGERVPRSRLGPKALEADVAVFHGLPRLIEVPPNISLYAPEDLRLVIEVLSPGTWRDDLGAGSADRVDRWRTWLDNGVPEYWIVNAGAEDAPIPPRSVLFLRNAGEHWAALEDPRLVLGDVTWRDAHVATSGCLRSHAVPDLDLDLDAYFASCARL